MDFFKQATHIKYINSVNTQEAGVQLLSSCLARNNCLLIHVQWNRDLPDTNKGTDI